MGGGGGAGVLDSVGAGSIVFEGACSFTFPVLVFICACATVIVKIASIERNNNFLMMMCFDSINDGVKMNIQTTSDHPVKAGYFR